MDNQALIVRTQREPLSTNEPQDIVMSDSDQVARTTVRTLPQSDEIDVRVINEAEFYAAQLKRQRDLVKSLQTKTQCLDTAMKKGQESNISLTHKLNASQRGLRDTTKALGDTRGNLRETSKALQDTREDLSHRSKALQDTQGNLRASEKELGKARRHQITLERRASKASQEHRNTTQELRKQLRSLQKELRSCQLKVGRLQGVEQSLQEAQEPMMPLRSELLACKDDLFRLQPATPLPDSEILKRFDSINQQIVNWIDAEIRAFEKANPNKPELIFAGGKDAEATVFLEDYPDAAEHLARSLIHRLLQVHILCADDYLLGLPKATQNLLRRAEQGLTRLKPPRDSSTIATWRSETIQAFAATDGYDILKQRQVRNIQDRIFHDLGEAFPLLFGQQSSDSFFQEVTMPAANLAVTIQGSCTKYTFGPLRSSNDRLKPVFAEDVRHSRLVEVRNGKHLTPNSMVMANDNGMIGNFVMTLEPGLFRNDRDGIRKVLLRPMLLIKLLYPLGKRTIEVRVNEPVGAREGSEGLDTK